MITVVRFIMIVIVYLLLPIYLLWIFGGWLADRCDQRRHRRIVEGEKR